jgi:hypothetical protein
VKVLLTLACCLATASTTVAEDQFVYLLSRGPTAYLHAFALHDDGSLDIKKSSALTQNPTEGWTEERRVLAYARAAKCVVFGLTNKLGTVKVQATGGYGDPQYVAFPGTRVDSVEVIERGDRTFVYAGQNNPVQIYGYELAKDGTLTALPGFPFETNTDVADMLQIGGFLYAAEYGNQFVSAYRIGNDGSLSDSIDQGYQTRPPTRAWQIAASPDATTLYVNSDGGGAIQVIQRDVKNGGVIFNSLVPIGIGNTSDTVIAAGKSLLAVADGTDADGVSNVRLFKMESGGRLRAFSDGASGSTGVSDNKFLAFGHGDAFLLVGSEAEQELRVLRVDKKQGVVGQLVDSSYLGNISKLATMIVFER